MEPFGALLKELRLATEVTTARAFHGVQRFRTGPLSQNELALRANVDPAYINRIERGDPIVPSRRVVVGLADGLNLDGATTARLLAAAGYWPWVDADGDVAELIVAAGLAIVAGDWRRVAGGDS